MEQKRSTPGRGPDRALLASRIVKPLWVVHGGMQAMAVRRLLASTPDGAQTVIGTGSVEELTAEDIPAVYRRLNHADVVISEDLPAGYRGLPVGVADLVDHIRPGVPILTFPRITYAGLHPFQVAARAELGPPPPLVPYHDLRLVAAAARLPSPRHGRLDADPRAVRQFASLQLLGLRTREVSGVGGAAALRRAGRDAVHTVDRPGNAVLVALARAIQTALGAAPTAKDPGAPLLSRYAAPVENAVADALGLPGRGTTRWGVEGRPISADTIRDAHREWYRRRPDVVRSILAAEGRRMELVGLI